MRLGKARLTKAFTMWLVTNGQRLNVSVVPISHTRNGMEFLFGLPESGVDCRLVGSVRWGSCDELVVAVECDGECVDLLLALEAMPRRYGRHVFCELCLKAAKPGASKGSGEFSSRQRLWRDHLFDPLREWINADLAHANGLRCYRNEGMTWAKLIRSTDKDDDAKWGFREVVWRTARCEFEDANGEANLRR